MSTLIRPILIFDGDCGFCRPWIERWRALLGDRIEMAPYQEVSSRYPQVPTERFAQAVHLFESAENRWSRGAEAVFRSLAYAPGHRWALVLYRHLPGFAAISEWCYRQVAAHRPFFSRVTRWIWGRHLVPPGEGLTAWVFLRALALIYAIAFASLWVQILGLVGNQGIYPASSFLQAIHQHYGASSYWLAPSLFWLGSGNAMLIAACVAGTFLAALLFLGFMPIVSLIGLYALYLSLATVCRDFLWFQWDGLLLETGILALFLAPRRFWSRPRSDPSPPRLGLWLLRWLLFRLMVSSALVKLASHDPNWRHLTALEFHYQTQPLPPWTAWYAHHFPGDFQRASALVMFAIEGVAPFFLFGPRRIRFAAATAIAGFQLLILLSGNYGFFNWLTLALCLLAFDDGVWPQSWGGKQRPTAVRTRGRWLVYPAGALLFLLSLVPLLGAGGISAPSSLRNLDQLVASLRIVNPYGLFAVMTTERPEIILEGSEDGNTWLPYEFRYKPGALTRRPSFVAPYQPRLDWQMWFAALGDARSEPWFFAFCLRLLEGSPPVLDLLEVNPFPRAPPRYVRAMVYDYRFTDSGTRKRTGAWWSRQERGPYCPTLALEGGKLVAVSGDHPQP